MLGLDTATAATAVALRLDDGAGDERRDDPAPREHPGHATRLLAMADALLAAQGLEWRSLERIAVGLGPGGFTGLRVGVATARGLAHALALELVGVSSLQALALPALETAPAEDGAERTGVLAVIDARRDEVFAAAYACAAGAAPRALTGARVLAPAGLGALIDEAGGLDPAPSGWLAVGDGALRYREQLELAGIAPAPAGSPLHRLRASAICELATATAPAAGYEQVVPEYLRRPDAELAFRGAGELSAPQR